MNNDWNLRSPECVRDRPLRLPGDRSDANRVSRAGDRKDVQLIGLVSVLWLAGENAPTLAQGFDTSGGEWLTYGGDLANTRYAPHDQIDSENFNDLEIAWRVNTASLRPTPVFNQQTTPLMADGVNYPTSDAAVDETIAADR